MNITAHDAYTSLMHSSVVGQGVCVKSSIKVGADVSTLNSLGVFSFGICISQTKCLGLFLKPGTDVNIGYNESITLVILPAQDE